MKKNIFKIAIALTVIAGAFVSRVNANAEAAPEASCNSAENTCYILTGPDGDQYAKKGVLVVETEF